MISILVPYRDNAAGERSEAFEASFQSVRRSLRLPTEPGAVEMLRGDSGDEIFNRSKTRNQLAKSAKGEILVFLDADTAWVPDQLHESIYAVKNLGGWSFPYTRYCALTEPGSHRFMSEGPDALTPIDFEYVFPSPETPEPSVGGCVVVDRKAFDTVAGYDERFIGWGFEDRAFSIALETMVGSPVRIPGSIYHLWHPDPVEERFGQPHIQDNQMLHNRYRNAHWNKAQMEILLNER
jgi:hypothetical protein